MVRANTRQAHLWRNKTSTRLAAWLAVVTLAGCQGEPTTVSGLVTLDGAPLSTRQGVRGTVVFQPADGEGSALTGRIDSSGRYELTAGGQPIVQPSVYWVTVSAVEILPPTAEHPEPKGRLITPARYASATDSGFRIEVEPGPNVVNLPLQSDDQPPAIDVSTVTTQRETEPSTPHEAPAAARE